MTYELPPLDSELEEELKIIIENKTFDPNIAKTSWESGILPKVISRLDQLVELSKNQSGDNVYDTIKKINDRIKSHLMSLMSTSPPFTIHRIAEIVLDPNGQGYNLTNNAQFLKYFNSLKKVFIVSSTVAEFPAVELPNKDEDVTVPTIGPIANNVTLVEIPWLKKDKETESEREPETTTTTVTAQKRENDEADEEENTTKKSKTEEVSKSD